MYASGSASDCTNMCSMCHDSCLTCSGGLYDNCVTCDAPDFLMNHICDPICPDGYYGNENGRVCSECDIMCELCHGFPNGHCDHCK